MVSPPDPTIDVALITHLAVMAVALTIAALTIAALTITAVVAAEVSHLLLLVLIAGPMLVLVLI